MADKKKSSYLDSIGSGYESKTVHDYDPATSEDQEGLEHEQEVAAENNWGSDNRDVVGRAASKRRRLASKLRRIAREIEAMELDGDYQEVLEDAVDKAEEVVEGSDAASAMEDELGDDSISITAAHPMEHDPEGDDPGANMPSDTGDEWISIGPGTFDDQRDLIGRAASKSKK
jgi:hypothetical protein